MPADERSLFLRTLKNLRLDKKAHSQLAFYPCQECDGISITRDMLLLQKVFSSHKRHVNDNPITAAETFKRNLRNYGFFLWRKGSSRNPTQYAHPVWRWSDPTTWQLPIKVGGTEGTEEQPAAASGSGNSDSSVDDAVHPIHGVSRTAGSAPAGQSSPSSPDATEGLAGAPGGSAPRGKGKYKKYKTARSSGPGPATHGALGENDEDLPSLLPSDDLPLPDLGLLGQEAAGHTAALINERRPSAFAGVPTRPTAGSQAKKARKAEHGALTGYDTDSVLHSAAGAGGRMPPAGGGGGGGLGHPQHMPRQLGQEQYVLYAAQAGLLEIEQQERDRGRSFDSLGLGFPDHSADAPAPLGVSNVSALHTPSVGALSTWAEPPLQDHARGTHEYLTGSTSLTPLLGLADGLGMPSLPEPGPPFAAMGSHQWQQGAGGGGSASPTEDQV